MPNSPPNLRSQAVGLRDFLKIAMPNARLTDATVNADYQSLLLMQTEHAVVAFAFANGDIRKSYEALYSSFKTHCTAQRDSWDAFDLAFVFCVAPNIQNLDHFSSNIETDVYFCRKFVVTLAAPLESSLARLPFLPLSRLHGQSLRPASAQTFLQQCGIPAVLAKYLVVQHARSPEGIVEDCATGEFGEPQQLISVANPPAVPQDRAVEPVRLETVEIENFRAYRKLQSFTLGADVTVLYGPNGFGKTSFFDAIDFAVTGGIGRIESHRASNFAKAVPHLDSGSEESTVSLSFRCNGAIRKITRAVSDRKQALLDGTTTDRKAILCELTAGDIPATDRVENFVSLFRASHLFSQEQQELTKGFHEDCCLPPQIVSRMLAFEDYANAVVKAAKVRDVVQTTLADASQVIRSISEQIAIDKKELERLGQTAKAHTNVAALDTEIEALRTKLVAAGVAVAQQKPSVAVVRGWRAAVESRRAESQSASNRLSVLAKELAGRPRMRAEVQSLQQQIAQKEESLKVADEKRSAAELRLQHAEQRLAEMTTKCADIQVRNTLLNWVRATKPVYMRLNGDQSRLVEELARAAEALAQQRIAAEKATSQLRAVQVGAAQAAEKQKSQGGQLAALRRLQESIPSWQDNRARLAANLQSEGIESRSLELLRTEERELLPQLEAAGAEEARLSRQIAEIEKSQSALKSLVSQLQGHIQTGICPLCGENHGSKDQLVQQIQEHVAANVTDGSRAELTGVRERAKQFVERIAVNQQKQKAAQSQLAALGMERGRLEAAIGQFANSAIQLGIDIESGAPTPADQVQARVEKLQREIANSSRQNESAAAAVEAARKEVASANNLVAAKNVDVVNLKTALAQSQEESNRLRADPRLAQISLDIDSDQLAELQRLSLTRLTEFKAEAATAEAESTKTRPEVSALRQETASLKAQLMALRTQVASLQRAISQLNVRLEESKLPIDSSEENLVARITQQSRIQAQLLVLRDSASNMELAIDAATTAAALTTLLQSVRDKENALARAVQKREAHHPWLTYFDEISRLISSQQNDAIANFTREYGPRTSVIQRRLRSVYGFDDIEIQSRDSTITVRVKRNGEELRPTDYFSQSQQQTLLLGLFLTACSSQTWSAFAPVFLDDPVTHFDDLNTYAFLDLIVGLLESEFGRRQFIISTCDEKLLQLARQKFRHLGERAAFYRFAAIGADGPTIEKVSV